MKKILILLTIIPFFSFSQNVDCIDSTAINPDCICISLYDPVLGCNGEVYSNECFAECDGVQYWTPINDGGETFCDSIGVNILSSSYEFIVFEYETFFSQEQSFGYAGFVLIDEMGDTVAVENIYTAENVYEITGGMNETRILEPYNDGYSLPLEAELHLIEGFFSGNLESICAISLELFHGPSQNDTIDLSGQWYSSQEQEYIEIDADSIYFYTLNEDFECYDFFNVAYQANDSVIFPLGENELSAVNYFIEDSIFPSTFNVVFENETLSYINNLFDPSELDICTPESFDCTPNGCVTLNNDQGNFQYLEDCESECENEQTESWDCIDGNCEILSNDSGMYNSYQSCVDMCIVTDLSNYQLSKQVIRLTDLLGKEVNPKSNQIIIIYYQDGSVEKKYFFKK